MTQKTKTPTRIIPPPPKKVDPLSNRMDAIANKERIRLMISGNVPPPNEFVKYLIAQYREARAEFDVTDALVRKTEQQLAQLKEKVLVVQGGVNKYLMDIENWIEKEDGTSNAPPPRKIENNLKELLPKVEHKAQPTTEEPPND